MSKIQKLLARQILDSKGNPTIETAAVLDGGVTVFASVPSGTSSGTHEAAELRDGDSTQFGGKGVLKAVENVNIIIANALLGRDPADQKNIDQTLIDLDGTPNKSKLGANAILSVSIACIKAAACANNSSVYRYITTLLNATSSSPTPKLLCNLINGGLHAGRNLDMQEFVVIPKSAETIALALEQVVSLNNALRKTLIDKGFTSLVGDEGGYAPKLETNEQAFELLASVISENNLNEGKVALGVDVAASSFFENGMYSIKDFERSISSMELGNYYKDLIAKYHLLYLEDPFAEDDFVGWTNFAKQVQEGTIVTGDDLTVTNKDRLQMALEKDMIRGIIIKPNQIGTITEAIDVVQKARTADIKIIVSHRSGETNDDFIADFAIGVGADFVKFGAPVRGERVAKYNRLLQIEQELQTSK